MFDFILQVLFGTSPLSLVASLFWPFVSIPDLIKISGLLVGVAVIQLWVRKCRKNSRRDA